MRNIIISLIFVMLISSFTSAEIIFSQTDEIYNFGDTLSTSATIAGVAIKYLSIISVIESLQIIIFSNETIS